jgi:hypothetical protein
MAIIPGGPGTNPGQGNVTTYNTQNGSTNLINPIPGSLTGQYNSGSTSNSSGWMPDLLMIFQEAAELAGVDLTTSYSLRSAKRSYDFLASEWANRGLNLWTIDTQSFPLIPNNPGPYVLPVDTMDVIFGLIRTFQGTGPEAQTDIIMPRFDFASYASIVDKNAIGMPTVFYINRLAYQSQIYFWLAPDAVQPYTFVYYRMRRIQNSGNATNTPDIPFRFLAPMTNGIAWKLSLKQQNKDLNKIAVLKAMYDESMLYAIREDRDRSPVMLSPGGYEY